jgi:predicted outer membrane repeat protein
MFVEDGTLEGNSVIVRDNDAPGFVFDGWAGALLVLGDTSDIKFTDCSFKNNIAGVAGAVWLNGGKSSWKDCVFESNLCRQGGFGGAVIPEGTSVNTFEDCEFTNNFSEFGGAVDDGTIAITLFKNCYFHGNRALFGGGYYAFADSQATFDGCRFINETAVNSGGAAEISSTTKPVFKNCHFEKNTAPVNSDISIFGGLVTKILDCKFARGGKEIPTVATHIKAQGNVIIERCEFEGGEALQGGSIYIISPQDIKIEGCTFKNNKATIQGGAIYIEG